MCCFMPVEVALNALHRCMSYNGDMDMSLMENVNEVQSGDYQ